MCNELSFRTKALAAAGLTGLSLALCPSPVRAQDRWTGQVRQQLVGSAVAAGYNGLELTHEPYTGVLNDGERYVVNLRLHAGTTYVVAGACDEDCDDLDLRLFDEHWNAISTDTDADDRPVVSVTPRHTAVFHIRTIMASCAASPCAFGLGVFGGR